MIKLCGSNDYHQLGERSNSLDIHGKSAINPPVNSHLKASSISSFSCYDSHTVAITNDGELLVAGDNRDGRIMGSLPKKKFKEFTKFDLTDSNGRQLHPTTAVCGTNFTLYNVSPSKKGGKNRLVYSCSDLKTAAPLFLSIGNSNPILLFGGFETAAAIDSDGSVLFVPKSEILCDSPNMQLERTRLPEDEDAVCVACCIECILAVSRSGCLYESPVPVSGNRLFFRKTKSASLEGKKITEVCGTYRHCFVVTENGQVYGRGENFGGQLGLNRNISEVDQFVLISSLTDAFISHVFAGMGHTLFLTVEGGVLECGSNGYGELLSRFPSWDSLCEPKETGITKGATFCIAGNCVSAVFIGHNPEKSPNRPIAQKKKGGLSEMSLLAAENARLREENAVLKATIEELLEKVKNLTSTETSNSSLEIFEQKTINKMKHGEVISRCQQSEVVKVTREEEFALKIFHLKKASSDVNTEKLLHEIECVQSLHHRNIIEVFGFCYGDESHPPSILQQLCPSCLEDVVSDMTKIERVCSIYEVSSAMAAVHASGAMHRDLKPGNILFDSGKHVRVSDFGVWCLASSMSGGFGTLRFMAPEILNESERCDEKVDVYAFGGVVFFVLTGGELPKISLTEQASGKMAKIPIEINENGCELISRCWSFKAEDRPSFKEIVDFIEKKKFELIDGVEEEVYKIKEFLSI